MTFQVVRQHGLLIVSGPAHDPQRKHLYVILTDSKNDPATNLLSVLMVPICSVVAGMYHDPACILQIGDHAFIKHDSYANYYRAIIEPVDKLRKGVTSGHIVPKGAVSDAAFRNLCKGLFDSKRAAPKHLQFYRH